MSNRSATKAMRLQVFDDVFGGKLSVVTHAMLARAVGVPRGTPAGSHHRASCLRRPPSAATARSRTSPPPWSSAQRSATRLASILKSAYGREIQINATVDPTVLGGIRVQVGAEVVDGTVLARLDDARRRLVG